MSSSRCATDEASSYDSSSTRLALGRYTASELEGMIPKEAVMASGMFAKEFRQARAEGLRLSCLDIVKYRHPDVLGRVTPAVQACASVTTLRKWTLAAARLPAADFVRLVTAAPSRKRGVSQRRAPRPARRASVRRAKFLAIVERSRASHKAGTGISTAEMRRRLGLKKGTR